MNASLCSATMLSWNRITRAQALRQGTGVHENIHSHDKSGTNMDAQVKKAAIWMCWSSGLDSRPLKILWHELVKRNYKVHLFDDSEGRPGGTWMKNHYPGATR